MTTETLESLPGVERAEARLVEFDGIGAIVSEFAGASVALTRENVFAHEHVVERILAYTTPLPFRFGTVVSEVRLRNYVRAKKASLLASLHRVRGCVEMSVKIIWNVEGMKQAAPAQGDETTAVPLSDGPGAQFLAAKAQEIAASETLKKRADEIAAWLDRSIGDLVVETRVWVRPDESLVVATSHMVERPRLDEYRARIARARQDRVELHFLTSGPWPPYSFIKSSLPLELSPEELLL